MSVIQFTSSKTPFRLKNSTRYKTWIERVILSYHKFPGEIEFIFTSDPVLAEMNERFLNHKEFTDILTFNYNTGIYVSGDIFISIDRVKENAKSFQLTFNSELERVMIHGILHLLGFDDKTIPAKKRMTRLEDESMLILSNTK